MMKLWLVELWKSRVQHLRPYYACTKPPQTDYPINSRHVWSLPLMWTCWSTLILAILLLALTVEDIMDTGSALANLNLALYLNTPLMVFWWRFAVLMSEEDSHSRYYKSKLRFCPCSMYSHSLLRNGCVMTRHFKSGVPVAMVVQPLKHKCCRRRRVKFIVHSRDSRRVISLLLILAGDVETNPGPLDIHDVDDTTILGQDDLLDVLEYLVNKQGKCYEIGSALKLDKDRLARIQSEYPDDTTRALIMIISDWLMWNYNTEWHGYPTWKVFAKAVKSPFGGNDTQLAEKIAKDHPLKPSEPRNAQISPFIASMSAPQVLPAIRNTSPAPGDSSTVDANSPPRSPSFSRSRHSIRSESVRAPSSPSLKQPSPHSPRDRPVIGEWRSKASPGGNSSTVDADSPPRSPSFNRSRHSIMLESIRAPSPPGSLRQPSLDSPRRPFIGDIPSIATRPRAPTKEGGRRKLPRGYGLLDWIRLCRKEKDLAGTDGEKRKITEEELANHCTEDDAWTAINKKVYNITPYMKFHPGGEEDLMKGAGKDSTVLFNEVHNWVNVESTLKACIVGPLEVSSKSPSDSMLYKAAMADGRMEMKSSDGVILGVAGSGKTSCLTMAVDGKVLKKRVSTPCAKAPVRTVSYTRIGVTKRQTLSRMEEDQYFNSISHSIMTEAKKEQAEKEQAMPTPSLPPPTVAMQPDTSDNLQELEDEIIYSFHDKSCPYDLLYDMHLSKLTDCGGQPQFLEVLPVFVHHMSLGIFTIKLNERLDHHPMIEYYGEDGKPIGEPYRCPYSHEEIIKRCVRAFISQGSHSEQFKFLFIGTHRDLLKDCKGETLSEKNIKLRKIVRSFNMDDHVAYSNPISGDLIFAINAKDPSPEDWEVIEDVRQEIAESSDVPPINIPVRWFAIELALMRYAKETQHAVLTEEACFDLVKGYSDKTDFKAALRYLHRAKLIFYFEERGLVVIDMQAILDTLSRIVRRNIELNTNSSARRRIPPNSRNIWLKFCVHGILNIKCLDEFDDHYVEGVFSAKELLELLIHLRIVSELSPDEFLMPSLLQMKEEACCNPEPETQAVPALAVEFPDGGPMLGLYCRLICYLISTAKWKVAEKDLKPYHLSRNSVHFSAPGGNPGRVTVNDPLSTFFVLTYHGPVATRVCPIVLSTILAGLEKVSETFSYTSQDKETTAVETAKPHLSFLCPCQTTPLHPAVVSEDRKFLMCKDDDMIYEEMTAAHKTWPIVFHPPPASVSPTPSTSQLQGPQPIITSQPPLDTPDSASVHETSPASNESPAMMPGSNPPSSVPHFPEEDYREIPSAAPVAISQQSTIGGTQVPIQLAAAPFAQEPDPYAVKVANIDDSTVLDTQHTNAVSKYIKTLTPDKSRELGAELGLTYNNLLRMPAGTLHLDMANAWLVGHDQSRDVSSDPTWRALALACAKQDMWGLVWRIEQEHFKRPKPGSPEFNLANVTQVLQGLPPSKLPDLAQELGVKESNIELWITRGSKPKASWAVLKAALLNVEASLAERIP